MQIRIAKCGQFHTSVATSFSSLGMTYLLYNELDKAEEYLIRALEIRKKIFGEDHQKTARSYFRLGCYFEQTKRYSQAIENYQNALHIWDVLLMNDYIDKYDAENRLSKLKNRKL